MSLSLVVMMQVYSSVIQFPAGLIPSFPEAASLTVYHDWLLPSLCHFHTPLWGVPGVTSQIRHLPLGPGSAQHLDPMQHSGYVCTTRSWKYTLAWVYNFPRAAIPNITDLGLKQQRCIISELRIWRPRPSMGRAGSLQGCKGGSALSPPLASLASI